MATYEESIRSITLDADATLAEYTGVPGLPGSANPNGGNQYRFVKITGAHQCGIADDADTTVIGVLQNKPQVTGAAATVALRGVSLCEAGGTISAGDVISVDADGKAVGGATTPAQVVGIAVGGAAAGQLVPVLLRLGA
jgi:hypothetical protein